MIDPQNPFASWFLWIAGVAFLLVFAVPLFLFPLRWGRVFQWKDVPENNLTVYFGRCLGGLALAVVLVCFEVAPIASQTPWIFSLILWASLAMVAVHVNGMIRRTQPWTENLEILLYLIMAFLSWFARFSLGPSIPVLH